VRHRYELDVEGPDVEAIAVAHRDQLRAPEQSGLLDAVAGEAEAERRPVDRRGDVAQQVRETADVVLVPVREHHALDAVGVVAQVGEIGQHEVDAGHVGVGEHQPAVDDEDPPVDLEAEAVASDLPQSAEEDDADRVRHAERLPANT
jgi:hypothetical protein